MQGALKSMYSLGMPHNTPGYEVPDKVIGKLADKLSLIMPSACRPSGWLGSRIAMNGLSRLALMDTAPLLAGYQSKPGSHPWIGEHVGKYLDALALEWARTGSKTIRVLLDETVSKLCACIEPDGYLGTYVPEQRFGLFQGADWDVWSHKYCLIGLLQTHRWTGNPLALETARKVGDLLFTVFGKNPQKLLAAGTHVGMAATSVLEPVVLLYRRSGDIKYLQLAHSILAAIENERGPRILSTLRTGASIEKVANGKAYEMLSNMIGLCEYARTIGDQEIVNTIERAAADIIANHLYITGTMSHGEHFHAHGVLPNDTNSNVGETCVTTTWIQLCAQLLRLTGKTIYAEQIEKSLFNHLAAAQNPDGKTWCYYTPLVGQKPYTPGINCCVSSGPRGMALAPALFATIASDQTLTFELPESVDITNSRCVWTQEVTWTATKGVGEVTFSWTLKSGTPGLYKVAWRQPAWTRPDHVSTVVRLPSQWKPGQTRSRVFRVHAIAIDGRDSNKTYRSYAYGPWILAAKSKGAGGADMTRNIVTPQRPHLIRQREFSLRCNTDTVTLVPFAEAGAKGEDYIVWLRTVAPNQPKTGNILLGGRESRSRRGNIDGSITDGNEKSMVVTYSGTVAAVDWFSVSLQSSIHVTSIVFTHGHSFPDGGWFIAPPMVEIMREPGTVWQPVGALPGYPNSGPDTTPSLQDGQPFTLKLKSKTQLVAVRVIGIPGHGTNPAQNFTSCAELSAFTD